METRSKVRGIPQGIPTTPFIKEVSETLPSVQGINPSLRKQQLVEEFPESKFPLPSETTQFHVSTEEPKHPILIHDPASPKSPKLEPSTSTQADDLVRAIKKLGKIKSDAGKLREPEPFTGKDPKKLKAFIFQCQLYFRNSDFDSDFKKVTFALSYLRDVAQEWFEPGISRLTDEPPEWFDNWEAFLDELRISGKLDSKGKPTQQEWQRRIDKNLCLFCGGSGHRTDTCPVKSARGRAVTTESVPTPSKSKESGTSSKKD
jgi:hypothetical protein